MLRSRYPVAALAICMAAAWAACAPPARPPGGERKSTPEGDAARGRPVVRAIYDYRNDRGLWPARLADLVPAYLTEDQVAGWFYRWDRAGWWQLQSPPGPGDWAVCYRPKGDRAGWAVVVGGVDEAPLKVDQPLPEPAPAVPAGARRAELERRVAAEPRRVAHYQGLAGHHLDSMAFDAAEAACRAGLKERPDHWWGHLALAEVQARRGRFAEAEAGLRAWAAAAAGRPIGKGLWIPDQVGGFPHYVLLAQLCERHGQTKLARASLAEAAKYKPAQLGPAGEMEVEAYSATGLAWQAGLLAYRKGWWDVAFAVCDRWQEYITEGSTGDPGGYLAVRAACHLARGEPEKAAGCLKEVHRKMDRLNYGWNHQLKDFEDAIGRKDTTFRYEPEPDKPLTETMPVFPPYE